MDKAIETTEGLLLENAKSAQALAKKISAQTRNLYTDGFHKQVSAQVAALNASNGAAKGVLMSRVIVNRIEGMAMLLSGGKEK